jgi:hypothetical protein
MWRMPSGNRKPGSETAAMRAYPWRHCRLSLKNRLSIVSSFAFCRVIDLAGGERRVMPRGGQNKSTNFFAASGDVGLIPHLVTSLLFRGSGNPTGFPLVLVLPTRI